MDQFRGWIWQDRVEGLICWGMVFDLSIELVDGICVFLIVYLFECLFIIRFFVDQEVYDWEVWIFCDVVDIFGWQFEIEDGVREIGDGEFVFGVFGFLRVWLCMFDELVCGEFFVVFDVWCVLQCVWCMLCLFMLCMSFDYVLFIDLVGFNLFMWMNLFICINFFICMNLVCGEGGVGGSDDYFEFGCGVCQFVIWLGLVLVCGFDFECGWWFVVVVFDIGCGEYFWLLDDIVMWRIDFDGVLVGFMDDVDLEWYFDLYGQLDGEIDVVVGYGIFIVGVVWQVVLDVDIFLIWVVGVFGVIDESMLLEIVVQVVMLLSWYCEDLMIGFLIDVLNLLFSYYYEILIDGLFSLMLYWLFVRV